MRRPSVGEVAASFLAKAEDGPSIIFPPGSGENTPPLVRSLTEPGCEQTMRLSEDLLDKLALSMVARSLSVSRPDDIPLPASDNALEQRQPHTLSINAPRCSDSSWLSRCSSISDLSECDRSDCSSVVSGLSSHVGSMCNTAFISRDVSPLRRRLEAKPLRRSITPPGRRRLDSPPSRRQHGEDDLFVFQQYQDSPAVLPVNTPTYRL